MWAPRLTKEEDKSKRCRGSTVAANGDAMTFKESREDSEQLFRHLFEEAPLGIAVENLDGKLLRANPALCSMLGYGEEELCGMSCSQFADPEDSQDDWALFQQLRAGTIDHYSLEKRYVRKDRVQIWGRLNVSLLKSGNGGSPLVVALVEDISERKLSEEALSSVSRRLIEAQEQERTRIARDLHDDINQRLALLAIELERLKISIPDSSGAVLLRVDELKKQTSEIANDIQALSHELHSPRLEYLGIVAAMRGFCQEFGEQQRVEIDFRSHDLPGPVPPDVSLCLFRVLQEALHNAAKHSGAPRFAVQLWGTPSEIHLTVGDSGMGFDLDAAMKGRGLGLLSMQERVRLVNGTISIASQPGGTTIDARVPINSQVASVRAAG
jgi:PAS domain S-box-containing protein